MSSTVRGMAIIAGGGKIYSAKRGFTMYAAFKNLNGSLHRDLMFLNEIDIFVAVPAGGGEIEGVDTRFFIIVRQDIMFAVAIGAGRDIGASGNLESAVLLVDLSFLVMAITAVDFREFLIVWYLAYAFMAIATFHTTVNRRLKDGIVDKE